MNLNRVIALYVAVAVIVLGVAGLLGAVLVLDSMHAGPDDAPVAPATP